MHGFDASAIAAGSTNPIQPYWGGNTMGFRHKLSSNVLHVDGHVAPVAARPKEENSQTIGFVDTRNHYIWRPGEHPGIGYTSPKNSLDFRGDAYTGCSSNAYPLTSGESVPNQLNPNWYTQNNAWTIPDIYEHKGWIVRPARGGEQ